MTTHSFINSLDEIDFDALFDGSLPAMDGTPEKPGTYPWPDGIETDEEKRAFVRQHIETVLGLPNAIAYKVIWEDRDVAAIFGTWHDDRFVGAISLLRPDLSGSRSWVWDEGIRADQAALLSGANIRQLIGFMPKDSPLRSSSFVDRHNLTDESYSPSPMPAIQEQLQTDVFNLNIGSPGAAA